jgi:integrase
MILVAYRRGFRASEIVDHEWSAIDFVRAEMHAERAPRMASRPRIRFVAMSCAS